MIEPLQEARRQRRIVIALAGLVATVLVLLGTWAIVDGRSVGGDRHSTIITIEGNAARWMGGLQICLGLLMLAIAMPTRTAALRWALTWVALAAVCLVAALRFR